MAPGFLSDKSKFSGRFVQFRGEFHERFLPESVLALVALVLRKGQVS